jgi:hypothetical protein
MPDEESNEEAHRFLTPERVENVAALVEPLIRDGLSWIERRKENVVILDDTALRRQVSVDFSLRGETKPVLDAEPDGDGEHLYCAPVFMLAKAPSNLMAFDLVDEAGLSLRLLSRSDNAHISGATLCQMAKRILKLHKKDLPAPLAKKLRTIAEVGADEGEQLALAILNGHQNEHLAETEILADHERFCWWLQTLAHSSILVVLYRARAPRRKIIKLTFEQPIASKLRRDTRLGWDAYRVWVDSPLIEARTYHFEAEAPPGLRIAEAKLSDDGHDEAVEDRGFLRRVHLYRQDAAVAGAGTALMRLRVTAGFGSGALIAAFLTTLALFACAVFADKIATNPTSAPALLLILPGLIASYIARPEQHALTTRLLAGARLLLLLSALLAYGAAAKLALSGGPVETQKEVAHRAHSLRIWLYPSAILATILLAGLAITYLRGRTRPWASTAEEPAETRFVCATVEQIHTSLRAGIPKPTGYERVELAEAGTYYVRSCWHGAWSVALTVSPSERGDGCWVTLDLVYASRLGHVPPRLLRSNDQERMAQFFTALQEWAVSAAVAD